MLAGIPKRKRIPLRRCASGPRRPASFLSHIAIAALLAAIGNGAAWAQNAPAQGFDPRAAERRFEAPQSNRPAPQLALAPRGTAAKASKKPLFVLRGVNVHHAHAIPQEVIAGTYRSYIGKRVSQAD